MHPARRASAFTLAELLLAVSLIAVAAMAVLGLFLSSRTSEEASFENAQGGHLALTEMRRLKSLPYSTLVTYLAAAPSPYNVTDAGVTYQATVAVTRRDPTVGSPDFDVLDLRLQLDWLQKKTLVVDQTGVGSATRANTKIIMHSAVAPAAAW